MASASSYDSQIQHTLGTDTKVMRLTLLHVAYMFFVAEESTLQIQKI